MRDVDVLVAGAGPAGLTLAAELAVRGVDVLLVSPDPGAPWDATLCGWSDELAAAPGFDTATSVRRRYDVVSVVDGAGRRRDLRRAYVLLSGTGAPAHLRERAAATGHYAEQPGRIRTCTPQRRTAVVDGDRGERWQARLVVDATGAAGVLSPHRRPPTLWQWAYGVVARLDPAPAPAGAAVLMDWTVPERPPTDAAPPSFLYVLDLGDGTHLVEETVLAGPRVPHVMALLERRLRARLRDSGLAVVEQRSVERVVIPLDGGRTGPRGPVVPFGVASGLVHPASGYSVTGSYLLAPVAAEAVVAGLRAGDPGDALARRVDAAVWTPGRRLAHAALLRGVRTALGDDPRDIAEFFEHFFALGQPAWSGYLAQPFDAASVVTTMTRLWRALPAGGSAGLARRFLGLPRRR